MPPIGLVGWMSCLVRPQITMSEAVQNPTLSPLKISRKNTYLKNENLVEICIISSCDESQLLL